jgi:hypothetical protein
MGHEPGNSPRPTERHGQRVTGKIDGDDDGGGSKNVRR